MARTPLFSFLRRAALRARIGSTPSSAAPDLERYLRERNVSRRAFLQGLGAATLGASALGQGGCSDDKASDEHDVRVAVIGAGLAGLHCAFRLRENGVMADVFEAWNRVGGRTFTSKADLAGGQLVELGGEFIDSGHLTMRALAREFDLKLDDLTTGSEQAAYLFDGELISEARIIDEFRPLARRMAEAASKEDDEAEFERLDRTSVAEWLAGEGDASPLMRKLLETAYVGEYGREAGEQSLWNLLWLIDYESPDPFHIFGDSDERYHLHQGSDAVARALASKLESQIETGTSLEAIREQSDGRLKLSLARGGRTFDETYDQIVLTLPFTQLRKVELDVSWSKAKREIIDELGYGQNAKLMMQFDARVWKNKGFDGSSFADNGLQSSWDTSRGQAGAHGILTKFVGGEAGVALGRDKQPAHVDEALGQLEELFPGVRDAYNGKSALMHWPSAPHHEGSYACYLPGQASFWGLEGKREGRVHFAGEHTSEEFQGYMEGAAETGYRAARELLRDLDIEIPETLSPE